MKPTQNMYGSDLYKLHAAIFTHKNHGECEFLIINDNLWWTLGYRCSTSKCMLKKLVLKLSFSTTKTCKTMRKVIEVLFVEAASTTKHGFLKDQHSKFPKCQRHRLGYDIWSSRHHQRLDMLNTCYQQWMDHTIRYSQKFDKKWSTRYTLGN